MAKSRKRASRSPPRQSQPLDQGKPPAQRPAPGRLGDANFWLAAAVVVVFLGSFWLALSALRVFCFSSVDSFWLIQAGRDILSQGRLPASDFYSFTHYGRPWILYQWLFEVALGLIDRAGGLQALQAATGVMAALIFSVLGLQGMTRRGVNFWVAWWVTASATAACLTFISLRPHLVSLLFVYLVKRLLDSHWERPGWRLLWLMPLFVVWANCHLMFAIGLAMVLAYWLAAFWVWLAGRGTAAAAANWNRFRLLGAAFVLCLGASLANPYGWEIFTYGALTTGQEYWTGRIGEVMAPQFNEPIGGMILAYIMLAILSFMVSTTRPPLPEALVFIGLLGAGLSSYKLLPYFVVSTMQATALRLQPALSQLVGTILPPRLGKVTQYLTAWSRSLYFSVPVLLLAFVFGLTRPVLFPPWVPVRAADFVEEHRQQGRLFCSAKFGSYLIYRFGGRLPVFIDTRFDMYGPEMSRAYFLAHREGVGWRALFERHSITWAMVESGSGIARILNSDPDWTRLYLDRDAAIFARRQPGPGGS
ncbi:MAG TPA: hypothetical protein V6D08_13900 [Candidatus Obscuribacterales bacterium]